MYGVLIFISVIKLSERNMQDKLKLPPIKPFFSIIMPAWNRAYCIKKALQSVLDQTYQNFEIIVYDAGSLDGTAQAARSLNDSRIRIGQYPISKGVNFSRNRAIELARADWLVLSDSDDCLTKEALDIIKTDIDKIEANTSLLFYGTKNIYSGKPLSFFIYEEGYLSYAEMLAEKKYQGEFAVVVRRTVFNQAKFPEDMIAFEKYFWLQVAKKSPVFVHNIFIRLFDSSGDNRYTKKIILPEFAKPRAYSYKKFLDTYGEDLKKANPHLYAKYLSRLAYLLFTSGNFPQGRKILYQSQRYRWSLTNFIMYLMSFSGTSFFRLIPKIMKYYIV